MWLELLMFWASCWVLLKKRWSPFPRPLNHLVFTLSLLILQNLQWLPLTTNKQKKTKPLNFSAWYLKLKTHQIHLEFSASTHLFTHAVFSTFSIPDLHQLKSFSRLSSDASSSRKPSLVSPAKGLLSPLNARAIFLPLLWQCYSLSCSLTIKGDAVDLPHWMVSLWRCMNLSCFCIPNT